MPKLTAVYDACVLYPAPLRDLLMQLATADLFRAKWTEDIHEEWIGSLLVNRPDLKRGPLERTRDLMNENVLDCLVTGYESMASALALPDPNDRHVLAAAIVARADVIVTFNLSDFPKSALQIYGIEAQHPDDFIRRQLESSPELVFMAVRRQRQSLRNPPKTAEELLDTLEHQRLTETVAYLRRFLHLL
jgi:predicted nucleic acid-binding protein